MRNDEEHKKVLRTHGLKVTDCRLDVFGFLLEENRTLFCSDLERQFPQHDRVTIYRTLLSFLESGIVHKVPTDTGIASYGLCHDTCSPDHHDHNHVHFKCNNCGKTECLDNMAIPSISLPEGYQVKATNMILEGICAICL